MEHSHTYLLTNAQWLLSCYKAEVSSCAENKLCLTPEAESIYYLDFYKKSLLTSVVKNLKAIYVLTYARLSLDRIQSTG